ncbi:MAG: hypothetical protein ACOVJ6_06220, partial [Pirellulales bacterium]
TGGFAMAFGDGSVRMISHDITPSVHKRLSTRSGIDSGEQPAPSVWWAGHDRLKPVLQGRHEARAAPSRQLSWHEIPSGIAMPARP